MKVVYVLCFCRRHSEQDHKGTLGGECEAGGVMLGSERLRGSNGEGYCFIGKPLTVLLWIHSSEEKGGKKYSEIVGRH